MSRPWFKFLTGLLVATAWSSQALANSAYPITVQNNELYVVAVASDKDESELEPGIYKTDRRTGELQLILPGTVLGVNRAYRGTLKFVTPRPGLGSNNNFLTVLNGRLTILGHNSNAKNPKTYLEFGGTSKAAVPAVDIVTGRPVSIPEITSMEDVSVLEAKEIKPSRSMPEGGQLLLASLRLPSPLGDGLTLAFVVSYGNASSTPKLYGNQVQVIGYEYLNFDALQRLAVIGGQIPATRNSTENDVNFYAPSMIAKFKHQLAHMDSTRPVLKTWIDQLTRFEQYILEGAKTEAQVQRGLWLSHGVPHFEFLKGRELLISLPIDPIYRTDHMVIGQVYDATRGDFALVNVLPASLVSFRTQRGVIEFVTNDNFEKVMIATGSVDRNEKTGEPYFFVQSKDDGAPQTENMQTFLYFSKGKLTGLAPSANAHAMNSFALNLEATPKDQIEFLTRRVVVDAEQHLMLILARRKAGSSRTQIYRYLFQDGDQWTRKDAIQIYDGPQMSFREVFYRMANSNEGWIFDNVSPVRGPAAYLQAEKGLADGMFFTHTEGIKVPKKTVPYLNLMSIGGSTQTYVRTLHEASLVQDYVTYRKYDPNGARESLTGFYITPKTEKAPNDGFLGGMPLFARKESSKTPPVHVIASRNLIPQQSGSTRYPSVRISLFPYTEKIIDRRKRPVDEVEATESGSASKTQKGTIQDVNTFEMGLAATPISDVGSANKIDGVLDSSTVELPYKSLVATQILQGTRAHAHEFYVLLFFRHDSSVKGSTDAVYAARGELKWAGTGEPKINVTYDRFVRVQKGSVPISNLKKHILTDAEGALYWVEDPDVEMSSNKFRVRKLSEPSDYVSARHGQVLSLREVEDLSDSGFGLATRRFAAGGEWEVHSSWALGSHVPGLKEAVEKKTKIKTKEREREDEAPAEEQPTEILRKPSRAEERAEARLIDGFEKYLDAMVTRGDENFLEKPQIIVVDHHLKEAFRSSLFMKLATGEGPFTLVGNKIHYFHADKSLDDVEISDELRYIASPSSEKKPNVLYVDSDMLIDSHVSTRALQEEPEDGGAIAKEYDEFGLSYNARNRDAPSPFPSVEANQPAKLAVLLSSDGRAKSLRGFNKLKPGPSKLPMITIMTPQEWRLLQAAHPDETRAGVFDNFDLNFNFLTSAWTVWPPNTDRAPEDMKPLVRIPYRAEEMRVFPTLDRILNEAASGEMRGRQKIILIPNELKGLVQKLILLRYSTNDPMAGAWNHSNRKLALHRIMGNPNANGQSAIQDNFRALRGASNTRNAILYSDLETVLRLDRPVEPNSSRGFMLRDPISRSKGWLLDSEGRRIVEQDSAPAPAPAETADADQPLTMDDLLSEIDSVDSQMVDLDERLESARKRRRVLGNSAAAQLDEEIRQGEEEYEKLRELRAALAAQVESMEEDPDRPGEEEENAPRRTVNEKSAYPHMMWWIATEGQTIQPSKKAGWKLRDAVKPRLGTILIGTEEELQRLEASMTFENKFFDLKEHFEITRLEAPDEMTKFKLVEQLFNRPETQSLGIKFELSHDNGRNPQSQLIYHFINRIDQLAYDQRIEKTSAFIRAYIALKNALSEDLDLRRTRKIDERFIERLFTTVFPMSLNPEILNDGDWIRRLRNLDQAVRDLQAAGYEGSTDLKRRFFETALSQTRPTDTSRPIPNSQILFGGTSSGKTYLLRSFFKMLGLVEYSASKPNNEDADYIFINVANLYDGKTDELGKISVSEAIAQIYDLLAQPKGPRAHIVFDDFHKAGAGVREQLSRFIQGLFEAPNGMLLVHSKDRKRTREIPVQNLNVYKTLNPTADESMRRRFVTTNAQGPDLLKREVLAAMSSKDFTPEESYLARWGDIVNLDNFPRSAKVPELVKRVRSNASRSGQMVFVDPMVIDALIDQFPNAHARELLSPAAAALTSLPPSVDPAPMYVVSLRPHWRHGLEAKSFAVGQQELQAAVRKHAQVDAIQSNSPRSLVTLVGFVMQNFRLQLYNTLSLEAHMTDILRLSRGGAPNILKTNMLLGLAMHVLNNPRIPTGEVVVRPEQYSFYSRSQLEELIGIFAEERARNPGYFPIDLDLQDRPASLDLNSFIHGKVFDSAAPKSRRDVLMATVGKLEGILQRAAATYFRLQDPAGLREMGVWNEARIKEWFQSLPEEDAQAELKPLAREILDAFFAFQDAFHGEDLVDLRGNGDSYSITLYDEIRLFAYAMDKAILRLPWGQMGNFTLNVAELSSDLSLGTRASFREYVGTHQLSPFSIATPEFMKDMLDTAFMVSGDAMKREVLPQLEEHFAQTCEQLLSGKKAGDQ